MELCGINCIGGGLLSPTASSCKNDLFLLGLLIVIGTLGYWIRGLMGGMVTLHQGAISGQRQSWKTHR